MVGIKFYDEEYCTGDCCFVLSTGRCGTTLLTKILDLSDDIFSVHEPMPTFSFGQNLIYHYGVARGQELKAMFYAGRHQLIDRVCRKMGKFYVETNHYCTFFSYIIFEMFPNAKFIHLVRHPGDYISSGMKRSWYCGYPKPIRSLLLPKQDSNIDFDGMDRMEKLAWQWQEINGWAEYFMADIKQYSGKSMFVKTEDVWKDPEISVRIFKFIGVEPPDSELIRRIIDVKLNAQLVGEFPEHKHWSEELKDRIKQLTPLGESYEYEW